MAKHTITGSVEDVQPIGERGWLVSVRDPSYLGGFAVAFFVSASELPVGIDEPCRGDVVEVQLSHVLGIRRGVAAE